MNNGFRLARLGHESTYGRIIVAIPIMNKSRTVHLLVVEDNPAYLYLVQKAFGDRRERNRWDLSVATDGQQALDLLFEEEEREVALPDLILLDWKLPKVSGDEVLRRIKLHQHLRKIPVLVFSSSEARADIHAAYGNHANGYITKPSNADSLAVIVRTIEEFWVAVAKLADVLRSDVS